MNLRETTVIYCGLQGVFVWKHSHVGCMSSVFGVRAGFSMDTSLISPHLSFRWLLSPRWQGKEWLVPKSLCRVWGEASPLLHDSGCPGRGGVCPPDVGLEALRPGSRQAPLSWVRARRWGECRSKWGLCTAWVGGCGLPRSSPRSCPFLCCIPPRSSARLWCGVGWGLGRRDCWNWGSCTAPGLGRRCGSLLARPVRPSSSVRLRVEWLEPGGGRAACKSKSADKATGRPAQTTLHRSVAKTRPWAWLPKIRCSAPVALPCACGDGVLPGSTQITTYLP